MDNPERVVYIENASERRCRREDWGSLAAMACARPHLSNRNSQDNNA